MGFDQRQNARVYRFSVIVKGEPNRDMAVTADLALFLNRHVGIQEGPSLCAGKLTADLERSFEGEHQLTDADLEAHAAARTAAEARRAEARRGAPRRPPAAASHEQTPWRRSAP